MKVLIENYFGPVQEGNKDEILLERPPVRGIFVWNQGFGNLGTQCGLYAERANSHEKFKFRGIVFFIQSTCE